MSRRFSRREFIGGATAAAAGVAAAGDTMLPTRPFGRTGQQVTILA
ncbi:MAG: twin-arginine translocation signal domain-containing protein, partial [Gemmatimonadales bacterium]